MNVNRSNLLQRLQAVQPGCAQTDNRGGGLMQSSCIVFRAGWAYTYNKEIACAIGTLLDKSITGAVHGSTLIGILKTIHEANVDITAEGSTLTIQCRGDLIRIPIDTEIKLPLNQIERPGSWQPIPPQFSEAVSLTEKCCKKKVERREEFAKSCINITQSFVQACDNFHASRYELSTFVADSVLVRGSALKEMSMLGCTEASETNDWLHFRNPLGLRFSVRCFHEPYPSLNKIFAVQGRPITLPRGLKDAAKRANIVADAGRDGKTAVVTLNPDGEIRILGAGIRGRYDGSRKSDSINGEAFTFRIPTRLLAELTDQRGSVEVSDVAIHIREGPHTYISSLEVVQD